MNSTPSRTRTTTWATILVVVPVLLAYLPALRGGWIWDDDSYVTENVHVLAADGLSAIWTLGHQAQSGAWVSNTPQYYPLVFTSFWVEHALFGLQPNVFHLTNVLLHLVNVWLVWKLLTRLGMPGAGIAAALFALSPMHVESVAWVTERKNVMSAAFYLLAFLAYLRFDDERRARWWTAAFLAFVAALLSKSVTATLPIVIATAIFWRRRRLGWRDIAPLIPFLALGVLAGWFTAWLEQVKVGATGSEFAHSGAERWLFVAPRAWWHYAETTWFPYPTMFVYPRWDPSVATALRWIAPVGIVALVAVLFAWKQRLGWAPILFVFASAITLAPALGFVPVYPHRYSWVADHFAYLGSIPLLALLVLAARFAGRFIPSAAQARIAIFVSAIVLATWAALVHRAARNFAGSRVLWEATLVENPTASLALVSLGIELMKSPTRTPADVARAKALFEAGARDPNLRDQAHTNLGHWHLLHADPASALRHFRAALEADPTHARARAGQSDAWFAQASALGATRAGLSSVRAARREAEDDVRLEQYEAWILSVSADPDVRDPRRARALAEGLLTRRGADFVLLDTLAAACAADGDFLAAIRHAEAALRIAPPQARATIEARLALYRDGKTHVEPATR